MNNPYIGDVNQSFSFARNQFLSVKSEETASERMKNQGYTYAGVWHLCNAYRAYISEVGANYKLEKPEKPKNAQELSIALELLRKDPAEAKELLTLEKTGFIGELHRALLQLESIPEGLMAPAPDKVEPKEFDPLSLKDVTSVEDRVEINAEKLSNWLNQFKALITRHRELMIEY